MKNLKVYLSLLLLSGSLSLTSCGASSKEPVSLLDESIQYDEEDYQRTLAKIDEIAQATQERQFEEAINYPNFFEEINIDNIKSMSVVWDSKREMYDTRWQSSVDLEFSIYFTEDNANYLKYLLSRTNCNKITICYAQNENIYSILEKMTDVEELYITSCSISDLECLANLTSLKKLHIENCSNITDISVLENLKDLEEVTIFGTKVQDVEPLSNLSKLTYLNLNCNEITNPEVLSDLENLRVLKLEYNNITNVNSLSSFVEKGILNQDKADCITRTTTNHDLIFTSINLEETTEPLILTIFYIDAKDEYYMQVINEQDECEAFLLNKEIFNVYNISKDLQNCIGIRIVNCPDNHIVDNFKNKQNVQYMQVSNCDFDSIHFITDFTNLVYLNVEECPNVDNDFDSIFSLSRLENLETLWIKNTGLTSFDSFYGQDKLTYVKLEGNELSDFAFLTHLPNLQYADLTIDNTNGDIENVKILLDNGVSVKINGVDITRDNLYLLEVLAKKGYVK